jgi:SIR2-like domain
LRPQQFAWLLGSGASASAGIPTGYMMIRDFKTRLFCRETGLPRRAVDSTDPLWVDRIDEFFAKRSLLPSAGDPTEYSEAFEAIYPSEAERRQYIEDAIRKGTPSFAHRVLAGLMTAKQLPCIFTTNFDPLVEIACTQTDQLVPAPDRAHCTVAAIDSADRAERCLRESAWPLVAKLHGDYQSIKLKNTTEELQQQDQKMRSALVGACERFGLIVVGYSGRDSSVMDALEQALGHPSAYPAGIYWVTPSEKRLLPAVSNFLERAAQSGISAHIVLSETFDEFAADLLRTTTIPDVLHEHAMQSRPREVLRPVRLPSGDARKWPVLRCSALPIVSMPAVARRLSLSDAVSTDEVRKLLKDAKVYGVASSIGREVAAFGQDDKLLNALSTVGARLAGTIALHPASDSWALGLLYDALTKALCRRRPLVPRLRRAGHMVLVSRGRENDDIDHTQVRRQRLAKLQSAYGSQLSGTVPELGFPYSEGVRIRLDRCLDKWWCVFEPFTFIDFPKKEEGVTEDDGGADASALSLRRGDPAGDWRRERWATRYNRVWTQIIDAWAELLSTSDENGIRATGTPPDSGIDADFGLIGVTAWSRPSHHHAYFERQR